MANELQVKDQTYDEVIAYLKSKDEFKAASDVLDLKNSLAKRAAKAFLEKTRRTK